MLRVASDHYSHSDTGRARRANEDSYLARAPVFVVADGMGGAQAGEIASRMAIEAFERGLSDGAGASGEELLADRVQEANQRIHEMSQSAMNRAGMGTTITARARRRARRRDRARRRLARVPAARRGVHAPDRGPLARRGDAPPRPAHRPGGRRAPAALDHHARPRARARRRRRHALLARRGGRRLSAVQRRADLDGPRVPGGGHRARGAHAVGRRPRADRRRQRGRRARQHHRRPVSPRGGRRGGGPGARAADLGRRRVGADHHRRRAHGGRRGAAGTPAPVAAAAPGRHRTGRATVAADRLPDAPAAPERARRTVRQARSGPAAGAWPSSSRSSP